MVSVSGSVADLQAALIDAGLIADPDSELLPELTPEEEEELRHLYALGFTWMARDIDGKLYAYKDRPKPDGAYWAAADTSDYTRITGHFNFVDPQGPEPWLIQALL